MRYEWDGIVSLHTVLVLVQITETFCDLCAYPTALLSIQLCLLLSLKAWQLDTWLLKANSTCSL